MKLNKLWSTYIVIFITNYPKEWKKTYTLKKRLYTDVFRSFIHNCQNLKAIKMPSCRWMSKQTMDHYLSRKWDELSSHKKRLKCTLLRNGYLMQDFSYTEHSRKGRTVGMTFAPTSEETNSSRGFLAWCGCSIDSCCVRCVTFYFRLNPQDCMPAREAICRYVSHAHCVVMTCPSMRNTLSLVGQGQR